LQIEFTNQVRSRISGSFSVGGRGGGFLLLVSPPVGDGGGDFSLSTRFQILNFGTSFTMICSSVTAAVNDNEQLRLFGTRTHTEALLLPPA
jgi:hypothetical protein